MSGICPTTPARTRNTYDDTVPVRDQVNQGTPDAAFNVCQGGQNQDVTVGPRPGGTTTETSNCCPSPGPAGPTGPQGPAGPAGADGQGVPIGGAIGQVLSKIDGTDYNTEWRDTNEVPAGGLTGQVLTKSTDTDYDYTWAISGVGDIVWRGYWQSGITYNDGDIVSNNKSSFVCNIEHVSDAGNEPNKEFDDSPGGFEWSLLSAGPTEEEQGLLDSLFDGVVDWVGDIENWDYGDWLLALAGGAGLIWAGTELIDMFEYEDPGDADSNYTGDAVYAGAHTPPTLQDLIDKICDRANIPSYDTSLIPNITAGSPPAEVRVNLVFKSITSARTALSLLSRIYFFDMVDSAGTLKFIPRGGQTSVKTLTYDDLGWSTSDSGTSPIATKRLQAIDLPRSIQVSYISADNAYNTMTQEARFETFADGQDSSISLPITLSEQEAVNLAEGLLVNAHMERTSYSFTTNYDQIDLEPGDVITLPDVGDVRILRIDDSSEDGLLNFQCVDASFNTETHTPSGMSAQLMPTYGDVPVSVGYSAGLTVELPPLDSTDVEQRLSIAPHGFGAEGWPGCSIYASTDGGVSYTQVASATKEATWGKVVSATAGVSNWHVWDDTTQILVELKTGTLSSVNEIDVYNGTNWCLIGEEVIGFKNATLQGSPANTYLLTGLLRGRRGTNTYIDTHAANEGFILLDNAIVELPYPLDFKEKVYYLKFVTNGSDISKATAYQAQPSQKSRRPWTIMNLAVEKIGNDYSITWTGRNQFNGEMTDSGTVTQPDGFGGFVVSIIDDSGSPEVIKRSNVVQTPYRNYTEAEQIADWGSVQPAYTIRIAQIDRLMGPGYSVTETL